MCAWDATKPAGATKIKDSDDEIRDNFAAIETVLGTNITAGPTTIQGAIQGDTTKGRIMRALYIKIDDGTNAATLKCTCTNRWNGDAIAVTDNIAKGATTGNFTLDAGGTQLIIEATGLTGNTVFTIGIVTDNKCGTGVVGVVSAGSNDIIINLLHSTTGAVQDITGLVDGGIIYLEIFYITDA